MKIYLVATYFFLFSLMVSAGDWMPDGMIVDKSGNVIHMVEMPDDFNGPKKTLTTLAFIADIEKGQTIVNLSKASAFKINENYDENAPPPNDGSGFMVTKYFKIGKKSLPIDLLGPVMDLTASPLGPVGPQLGIMLEIDGGIVGELYAKTYADIKKLPKFALVPYNLKTLGKYKIGDSLSYNVHGGVGFMMGAGAMAKISKIGAGVAVNFAVLGVGKWACNVKKTGPTTVSARYVKQKLKKMSVFLDLKLVKTIGHFEAAKFDGTGVGTFYEFNLANPLGLKAYKKFLLGNTVFAENLSKKIKAAKAFGHGGHTAKDLGKRMMKSPVRPLMSYKAKIKGTEKSFSMELPILIGLKARRGENFVVSETKIAGSGLTIKTHLGVYKDERETFGLLKRNNYRLAMFTGNYQRIFRHNSKGEALFTSRYSGNYKYQYHSEKLKEGELEEEIFNLVRRIGFKDELSKLKIRQAAVNIRKYLEWKGKEVLHKGKKIPLSLKSKTKILGSTKISADLMIGMAAIKELIGKALKSGERWKKPILAKIDKWFANPENKRWEICTVIAKGRKSVLGRKICEMKTRRNTEKGMDLAYKSLVRMQGNIGKHEYKKFTKNFADFGKGMGQNKFTFNGILDLIKRGDIHLVVQWEGERIPKGELVLIKSKKVKFNGLKRMRK
jgi:hypothetical protein